MIKPRVGMIQIKNNEISQKYKEIVSPSWINAGYALEYHDAITPETLPNTLKFGKKTGGRSKGKELTPTEKAIWYSHIAMWKIASLKSNPFLIIEHDVMLLKPIAHELIEKYPIVNLSHCGLLSKYPEKGYRVSAGGAYLLKKDMAKQMIDNLPETITYNSDGYIHNYIARYGAFRHEHCTQLYVPSFGATIDHG